MKILAPVLIGLAAYYIARHYKHDTTVAYIIGNTIGLVLFEKMK